MSGTEPVVRCDCGGTHREPRWHRVTVVNAAGWLLTVGRHGRTVELAAQGSPTSVGTHSASTLLVASMIRANTRSRKHIVARGG